MKIEVNKKVFMFVLGTMFLLAGGLVYAYGGSSPAVVGHSSGEIELPSDICRTSGSGCPSRLSGCSFSCTTDSRCSSSPKCPSGYTATGTASQCSANNVFKWRCCRLSCS
jgi:hypothetical protein